MAFSVAIVEDTRGDMEKLVSALRRYEREHGIVISIAVFDRAEMFLLGYKPVYDIVFMDIEMDGINGMDAACKLREFDDCVNIIFVTNMSQYALDGYKVGAMDYFVKPVSYFDIEMRLQRVLRTKETEGNLVKIVTPGGIKTVYTSEVKYIEIMNHTLTYHTTQGNFSVRGDGLSKLEKQLESEGFARCSSSYLVNLNKCNEINSDSIRVGGEELRLTRGMRKNFIDKFSEMLADKGGLK